VLFQDRIADRDAYAADTDAVGRLRWIRDKYVYLVLGLAAKRTSEDYILLAALEKHESSMASERRKSRFAKVESAADLAEAFRFQQSIQRLLTFGQPD